MEIVEFRSARSDVFPAPTPTAGTLPSSLPVEVEAGGVAPEVEIETPVAPVALAWITWKEIGSDNAIKRFAGALALRTTPGFLCIGPANTLWPSRLKKRTSKEKSMFDVATEEEARRREWMFHAQGESGSLNCHGKLC